MGSCLRTDLKLKGEFVLFLLEVAWGFYFKGTDPLGLCTHVSNGTSYFHVVYRIRV